MKTSNMVSGRKTLIRYSVSDTNFLIRKSERAKSTFPNASLRAYPDGSQDREWIAAKSIKDF
jgi:hypothetical protein